MNNKRIPIHVAMIMDGNGRWAKSRGLDRSDGHIEGVYSVISAVESAVEIGVKYLTIYAFSTENWNRPLEEVEAIMSLFCNSIEEHLESLNKNGVGVKFMGDFSKLNASVLGQMDKCINTTKDNDRLTLIVAMNYSSRWEICRMVKMISQEVSSGELKIENIDDNCISKHMFINTVPDPDLIIRTSGEYRLSNFLLWQAAYSEFYFTDVLWPDFRKEEFKNAIEHYGQRSRRYGAL